MNHLKAVNISLAFLISAQALTAATYYLAPGGDDDNPGTIERPWATVSQAVGSVSPGDVIILRDGVYGPEGGTYGFPVWITQPGSPSAWIVIRAEHKWGAILDCKPDANAQAGCDGYIYLHSGAAYWVFQDLVFRHGFNFGMSSNSTPAAHDILVRGCRFEYIGRHPSDSVYGEAGVYAGAGSNNFTFDGNIFHDIGRTSGIYPSNDHALYLHSAGASIVNNIFYGPISGWGVQTADGFSGLIAHNTFAFPMRNTGGHIVLWGSNPQVTIRNNIFYNPQGAIAINYYGLTVSGGCAVDHNVITGGTPGVVPGCSFSNNIQTDAGLVNAATDPYDFHLRTGSPAVGAGAPVPSVTTDFDGATRPSGVSPDAGAYIFPATPAPVAGLRWPFKPKSRSSSKER